MIICKKQPGVTRGDGREGGERGKEGGEEEGKIVADGTDWVEGSIRGPRGPKNL